MSEVPHMPRVDTFTNDGFAFPAIDTGPLEGEVVVLLHGFPQNGAAWAEVARRLNEQGLRTIAPDLRGYAATARPRGRLAYRSSQLVGDVAALVAAAAGPGGRVHLVGHDWGALLAWSVAGQRPDLVRSLVAVSVPHYAAFVQALFTSDQLRRSAYIVLFQLPVVPELLIHRAPGAFAERLRASGMREAGIERVQREVVDSGALTAAINWYRGLLVSDQRAMWRPVDVPTTLVWGDRDTLLGPAGITLAARHVRAPYALEILRGAGHWLPDDRPDELAEIILQRVGSVSGEASWRVRTRHGLP
jgi:pimeloyl-ACP methyl ester carboxylesterase